MRFEDLEKRVGLSLAVLLMNETKQLELVPFDEFSYEQWLEVNKKSVLQSDLWKLSIDGMIKSSKYLGEWYALYLIVHSDNSLHKSILEGIERTETFSEWEHIYLNQHTSKKNKRIIFKRLSKIAKTFGDLFRLSDLTQSKDIQEEIIKRMTLVAKNFTEWMTINRRSNPGSELRKTSMTRMVETAENLDNWMSVYRYSDSGSESKKIAIKKIPDIAKSFWEWQRVSSICEAGSEFSKIVIDNMIKIGTLEDWINFYQDHSNDKEVRRKAMERILELAKTFEEWLKIYQVSDNGTNLQQFALLKMEETGDFDHWIPIYRQDLRKKRSPDIIIRLATTLEHWSKIFEISKPKSELRKTAIKKMVELM